MDFWHLALVACYHISDNAGAPSTAQNTPGGFLEEPWPTPCLQGCVRVGQERQACGDAQAIPNGGNMTQCVLSRNHKKHGINGHRERGREWQEMGLVSEVGGPRPR